MNEHENSHFNWSCNRIGLGLWHLATAAVTATTNIGNQ